MIKEKDEEKYDYTVKTYEYPHAIVRVHRPILPPDEYERRMEKFKKATADFLRKVERQKRRVAEEEVELLEIDGKWGRKTTLAAQKVFGTVQDEYISKQLDCYRAANPGLCSCRWDGKSSDKGSAIIRAIQKKVGAKIDGHIGPETIGLMQKWLETPVDGYISNPSTMVKAFQRWLNSQLLTA